MPSFADVGSTSYSFGRRVAFVPWYWRQQCWPSPRIMVVVYHLCMCARSNSSMPWCCGIAVANSSNASIEPLIVFRTLGWIDLCWNGPVMNRPQDEPTVLNRPVMNRPVMKRPGIPPPITTINKRRWLHVLGASYCYQIFETLRLCQCAADRN